MINYLKCFFFCLLNYFLIRTRSAENLFLFNPETEQKGSRLYKPTSKLAQLASTFSSVKDVKKEPERKEEKPKLVGDETNWFSLIYWEP